MDFLRFSYYSRLRVAWREYNINIIIRAYNVKIIIYYYHHRKSEKIPSSTLSSERRRRAYGAVSGVSMIIIIIIKHHIPRSVRTSVGGPRLPRLMLLYSCYTALARHRDIVRHRHRVCRYSRHRASLSPKPPPPPPRSLAVSGRERAPPKRLADGRRRGRGPGRDWFSLSLVFRVSRTFRLARTPFPPLRRAHVPSSPFSAHIVLFSHLCLFYSIFFHRIVRYYFLSFTVFFFPQAHVTVFIIIL